MITDLRKQLQRGNDTELVKKIEDLLQNIITVPKEKTSNFDTVSQRSEASFDQLESGIYVLRQRSESETSAYVENEMKSALNGQTKTTDSNINCKGNNEAMITGYRQNIKLDEEINNWTNRNKRQIQKIQSRIRDYQGKIVSPERSTFYPGISHQKLK